MKKMVVLVLLLVLSFVMFGCKEDKSDVDDEVAKIELLSTEEFKVDVIGSYEYTYGERVYIYKHIVGYTDEKNPQPIYALVVSKDVYDVGDTFEVATIKYTNGKSEFNYRTIQFESGEFDTSWHKYAERL
jgi:hypothetical protein